MMNPQVTVWLMVIASTFFWGSNFNAGHAIAGDVAPLTAAADRFGVAVILFLLLRLVQGKAESQLQWKDGLALIPLGIIGVFGFNYAFFTALHTTSALNAALIMALSPMLSLVFSAWLLNTRIKAYQYFGIALAFIGVSLVITGGNFGLLHIAVGDAWMLGACTVWSLYSVGAKKFAAHIPSLQLARWTVSVGAIALIIAACLLEQPFTSIPQLSLETHSILFYMSICGTVLAYIFWLRGVHFLGPDKSAIAFNLVPVFTLLVSLALGSLPNMIQLAGMLLVLIGVVISSGWRPGSWRPELKHTIE
jgi:drug/metabolite transporter (DMT)-like permease